MRWTSSLTEETRAALNLRHVPGLVCGVDLLEAQLGRKEERSLTKGMLGQ